MHRLENPYDWFSLLNVTYIDQFIYIINIIPERKDDPKDLKPVQWASLDRPVGIYGTYRIPILQCMLITYITSMM